MKKTHTFGELLRFTFNERFGRSPLYNHSKTWVTATRNMINVGGTSSVASEVITVDEDLQDPRPTIVDDPIGKNGKL